MKKKSNQLVVLSAALAVLAIIGTVALLTPAAKVRLSGEQFLEKYSTTPASVLVDVRTPAEFAAGHIEGAVNIDFENQSFLGEIKKLDPTKTYFVYCRSGNRSGQAISLMKAQGINTIYELQGGIVANKGTVPLVSGAASGTQDYVVDASDIVDGQAIISGISSSKTSTLTEKEKAGLIQMREEEKLARDVYTTLGNLWGTKIFFNIAASEQTHTDAVRALLVKYNVKDPVTDDTVGVFTSKTMQDLYATLVAEGKLSQAKAITVGATIEDLDIYDLDVLLQATDKEDIRLVYANLQRGSRNHMRAFVRSSGGVYTPQYISQSTYASIINSPQERGRQ